MDSVDQIDELMKKVYYDLKNKRKNHQIGKGLAEKMLPESFERQTAIVKISPAEIQLQEDDWKYFDNESSRKSSRDGEEGTGEFHIIQEKKSKKNGPKYNL